MTDLNRIFRVGQQVRCRLDRMHKGTIRRVEADHIVVDIPEVNDHVWFVAGCNIEDVYPEYNFQ